MILFWGLINLAVIFDAIGDAFFKKQKWFLSKLFQMLMVLSFSAMIVLSYYMPDTVIERWYDWGYIALMYILIRIGLFNAVWGIVKFGYCYWYYLGKTSLWDKLLNGIIVKTDFPQKHFLFWIYLISWVMSIGVLTNCFYLINF